MLPKTLEWKDNQLRVLDQTKLPHQVTYVACKTHRDVAEAIRKMKVRGAPAIGVAAAFGLYLGLVESKAKSYDEFFREFTKAEGELSQTRPTARNLFWALERMKNLLQARRNEPPERLKRLLLKEAISIHREDQDLCQKIGKNGAILIEDGDRILTHCNAGSLATSGIGTALGVIYTARGEGKRIKVYADETRPALQGARLTVWELTQAGVDVTLVCDSAAGTLMRRKMIDVVLVGADRIATNGDFGNKIGTYNLAILAKEHGIPFYVAAPYSTIDQSLESGEKIQIEERKGEEVTYIAGQGITLDGVTVYNPVFDVTPHHYVDGIITDRGIFKPNSPGKNFLDRGE